MRLTHDIYEVIDRKKKKYSQNLKMFLQIQRTIEMCQNKKNILKRAKEDNEYLIQCKINPSSNLQMFKLLEKRVELIFFRINLEIGDCGPVTETENEKMLTFS